MKTTVQHTADVPEDFRHVLISDERVNSLMIAKARLTNPSLFYAPSGNKEVRAWHPGAVRFSDNGVLLNTRMTLNGKTFQELEVCVPYEHCIFVLD